MNKKIIGYILAGVGLLIIILATPAARAMLGLSFLDAYGKIQTALGLACIVAGAVLLVNPVSRSSKQEEEVPIYEGHGKERKIVAYRKLTPEEIKNQLGK
ncbi:MAG: hypothetical protein AABX11_06170 [Nanoarchaeota archaeon]